MLLPLILIFLLYVGMTMGLRLFIASISNLQILSPASEIFFIAFLPVVLFLSATLFLGFDVDSANLIFILVLAGARIVVLLVDGNKYIQRIVLHEDTVEISYLTDFLQQKTLIIPFQSIRSVKLDHAERLIDFPCRLQFLLKKGGPVKLHIVDPEQLRLQQESIFEIVRRLEFSER